MLVISYFSYSFDPKKNFYHWGFKLSRVCVIWNGYDITWPYSVTKDGTYNFKLPFFIAFRAGY